MTSNCSPSDTLDLAELLDFMRFNRRFRNSCVLSSLEELLRDEEEPLLAFFFLPLMTRLRELLIRGRTGKFATAFVGLVGGFSCGAASEMVFADGSVFVDGSTFTGDGVRDRILLLLLLGGSGRTCGMSVKAGMPMGGSVSSSGSLRDISRVIEMLKW